MLISDFLPNRIIVPAISLILVIFQPSAHAASRSSVGVSSRSISISQDLVKAVEIAEDNARPRSTKYCWRYVKRALVQAQAVDSYPKGVSAKYAGRVLTEDYGFTKLKDIKTPHDAPVGAILVYGGKGHGHVEFRTEDGFVSDFKTSRPSRRPLIGVYVKVETT